MTLSHFNPLKKCAFILPGNASTAMEQRRVLDLVKQFEAHHIYSSEAPIETRNVSCKIQTGAPGGKGATFLPNETIVKANQSLGKRWFGEASQKNMTARTTGNQISCEGGTMFLKESALSEKVSDAQDTSIFKLDEYEFHSARTSVSANWSDIEQEANVYGDEVFLSATDTEFGENAFPDNQFQSFKEISQLMSAKQDDNEEHYFSAKPNNDKEFLDITPAEISTEISNNLDSNPINSCLVNDEKIKIEIPSTLEAITEAVLFQDVESANSVKKQADSVIQLGHDDKSEKNMLLLQKQLQSSNNIEELFNEIMEWCEGEVEDVDAKFLEIFQNSFKFDIQEINSDIEIYNTMTESIL